MYSQLFKDIFVINIWAIAIMICILHEEELIKFEHKLWRKIKKYAVAFVRSVAACIAERKGYMFIIFKSPGREPERRHNIGNTLKAIEAEIDAERAHHVEVLPGIYMCYDADGFLKDFAPCITDERAENMIYGDVAFYAVNSKENGLRCLTEKEANLALKYISEFRADLLG